MRQRVIYHGRVQGVGFRATVASIARRHPVAGFVRNLPDGTVELVAEGAQDALEGFREEIAQAMSRNITRQDVAAAEDSGAFDGFSIRR